MSKIRPERAFTKKSINAFAGIRDAAVSNESSAADMRNFRILKDGILEKRYGWYTWRNFREEIRGFWQGTLGEKHLYFLVSGASVYYGTEDLGMSSIGTVSAGGKIGFFRFGDRLYLQDGSVLRVFEPATLTFVKAHGYAPLYGLNWHPVQFGDTYEPLNLLTPRLRVHYLNTEGSATIYLPFFAASLDKVRVNNQTTTSYSFSAGSDRFTLNSPRAGDVVEVAFTISGDNVTRNQIHASTQSFLYQDGENERILLFGSTPGYRLFCSAEADEKRVNESRVFYSDSDSLYFRSSQILSVGDADHPITALCANHDRILAFHTAGAWSINLDAKSDEVSSYPVLYGFGCTSPDAVLTLGNDPILINESGVCRLHSTVGDPDRFSVKILSDKIPSRITFTMKKNALLFWDAPHGELWVRDATETDQGLVWIWNEALEEWYCFDGIPATLFFRRNGEVAFAAANRLLQFHTGYYIDGGNDYTAYYDSNYMSMSRSDRCKRSLRATFCVHSRGSVLICDLDADGNSYQFSFAGENTQVPEFFDIRALPGRFRFLRYRISCAENVPARIYEANFYTRL